MLNLSPKWKPVVHLFRAGLYSCSSTCKRKHPTVYSPCPSLSYCEIDDPGTGGLLQREPLAGTRPNMGLCHSRNVWQCCPTTADLFVGSICNWIVMHRMEDVKKKILWYRQKLRRTYTTVTLLPLWRSFLISENKNIKSKERRRRNRGCIRHSTSNSSLAAKETSPRTAM